MQIQFLLLTQILLLASLASAQTVDLRGHWSLAELSCLEPNKPVERIAPGLPGAREAFDLIFISERQYLFSAEYVGLLGEDCRLHTEGDYRITQNDVDQISAIRLNPSSSRLKKSGTFEAPCRVLTTEKSLLYEARLESQPGPLVTGPYNRLRMRVNDTLGRCDHRKAKLEMLFEPSSVKPKDSKNWSQ